MPSDKPFVATLRSALRFHLTQASRGFDAALRLCSFRSVDLKIGSLGPASLFICLCLGIGTPLARAQYSSGVDGTIQDSSNAIVAGATVKLTDLNLGITKTTTSNGSGYFRIDSIAASSYRVEVTAPSFKSWVETGLTLQVGEVRTIAPILELGAVSTTVTVSAAQAALDLTSASTAAVVTRDTVTQTPLVGQNVYSLAALAPGVTGPGLTSGDNFNNQYGIQINAAGQRQESNSFIIDGAYVDTPSLGGEASVSPNPEIIQSLQTNTNEFDASKGRTSGANVQLFTNSGTNTVHGTGDYFFLNDALTARTEFESKVPSYTRQEGGATIGGPIIKNKLFAFGAIDVLRSSAGFSESATVETQDFENYVQSNFGNNLAVQIMKLAPPASYATSDILTVAQVEAQNPGYYAAPSIPATLPAIGNVNVSYAQPRNAYQWSFRVDDYIGEKDRIYGTALRTVVTTSNTGARPALNASYPNNATFVNIGWTHTFSARFLNETGVSYVRPSSKIELPPTLGGLPDFSVVGFSAPGGAFIGIWAQNTIGWREIFTATVKSHELKVGAYIEDIRENDTIPFRPSYNFNNLLDYIQDKPTTESGVAINLKSLEAVTALENYRQPYTGIFLQDNWKAKPNLTVNAGIRYDSQGHLAEFINPPLSLFNLGSGATLNEQIANGVVAPPHNSNQAVDHNVWEFSPRLGFSWDVFKNGRTAIRGGFGLFSDRMPYRNFTGLVTSNLPLSYTPSLSVYSGDSTPAFSSCTTHGYNLDCPLLIPANIEFDAHGGLVGQRGNLGGFSPNSKMGQIENWTLSVQQQLTESLVFELNYSGLASHHLPITTDINRFGGDLIVNNGVLTRLNQSFGTINYQTTNGNSSGNYGSAMLTQRMHHGVALRGIYTWGKVLDVYSTAGTLQGACACQTTNIIQADNFKAQRGRADFDVRQQFSADGVWTLPSPWSNGWKGDALGGWRLGGVAIISTGLPFTVYTTAPFPTGDFNADGFDYDVPNTPAFGNHLQGQGRQSFLHGLFPASAFPNPSFGQEGDLGRNTYDQPGYANVNLNAAKLVFLPWFHGEKLNLELRGEIFNLFNRANLVNVDGNLADSEFAHATSQLPARAVQAHIRVQF
jgi:carboxypeptidase family protein/TonB-dependent receptor-like protein